MRKTYFTIAEKLDRTPAADGTDGAMFRFLTFFTLYNEGSYGRTAGYWQMYLNATSAAPRKKEQAPNPADNALTVYLAVTCNDIDWPEDVDTYRRAVAEDRKRHPLFGAAAANIIPCAFWAYEPYEPPAKITKDGPEVLILQNRYDPVTPYAGGKLLREKFGDRARLVTAEGSGHGVYVLGGNACALNLTTSYLVDGVLPAEDTTCRA